MMAVKSRLIRAVWNGPFYIGPLSRPVSVGDVLLKTLEVLWRMVISTVVLILIIALGIAAWVQLIEPTFFPPLKAQISATAIYDDGTKEWPPSLNGKRFRCTPDYPIQVEFRNQSKTTIGHLDFAIEGRPANRSDNVVQQAAWMQSDEIIPPGYSWQGCWAVTVPEGVSPRSLDYKVVVWGATEADANTKPKPAAASASEVPPPMTAQAVPSPTPTPTSNVSLDTLKETDWQKIGMGCSCTFSAGAPAKAKLIAGGDGLAFFRLNGKDNLCTAPDTQTLFDGPVAMSCGSTAVQVTPFGKIQPGEDGHSSNARLHIADTAGTLSLTGTWGCSC